VSPRKPRRTAAPPALLGSAACARRTGLTVRTLRLYERRGLISPARSANGWRRYGARELTRLNAIVTLKTMGLTLREIAAVLGSKPPSLARILQLQLGACQARRRAADEALVLVQAALARLASRDQISIDDLCNLARSIEMADQRSTWRDLVNESIAPDEERQYLTWWAHRPREEAEAMRAYSDAQRTLFDALQALQVRGAEPGSEEVQALMTQHNALMLKYRVRESVVALMEWNPTVTRKFMAVGSRAQQQARAAAGNARSPAREEYFIAALGASEWGRASRELVVEARELLKQNVLPSSKPARALAARLKTMCRRYGLGDPVIYALATSYIAKTRRDGEWVELNEEERAGWRYLADAARRGARRKRTPVD
jgi:DNA-binding transcriptional MerR regulator